MAGNQKCQKEMRKQSTSARPADILKSVFLLGAVHMTLVIKHVLSGWMNGWEMRISKY